MRPKFSKLFRTPADSAIAETPRKNAICENALRENARRENVRRENADAD
jgi:hypothetical protein